jgi:WD repeat-containing protein 23
MTNVRDLAPTQIPISFEGQAWSDDAYSRIFSCRFSADGNEIVAGGNGKIFGESSSGSFVVQIVKIL